MRLPVFALACSAIVQLACASPARPAVDATPPVTVPKLADAPSLAPEVASADSWRDVPSETLAWDVAHKRRATETTNARVATDGTFLYVRFEARQREGIAASQRTNDVGGGSDDEVYVDLWPTGTNGFEYAFVSTPIGTHYESSSENNAYQPTWFSRGALVSGGYVVVMKIPLAALRGSSAGGTWRAQLVRVIHATGEQQVWNYGADQVNADDVFYAGRLVVPKGDSASRPEPRLALYGLGALASDPAGGTTSRAGADLSLPVTATSSFFATVHPDYSGVELDQQSIAPTAFQRYYGEVRPFFTQGANFYNNVNCDVCSQVSELYTPSIPTPRNGYAIEGQQGPLGFAAFDAVGVARSDVASALDFTSPNREWGASVQRVAVTTPQLLDDTTSGGVTWTDRKNLSAYANYGEHDGTNVVVGSEAQRYEAGGGWGSQTFAIYGSARKIGDDYLPVDGFVQHAGIAGYGLYSNKIWLFDANSKLESISLGGYLDRYHGKTLGLDQTDNTLLLDVLTRSLVDVQLSTGSDYLRLPNGVFSPVSQNGITATYHSGSSQNAGNFGQHGSSATPTSISYQTGRYGDGRLDSWLRSSTIRVGLRGTLTPELDDTAQWFAHGASNVQWFERLSYAYQLGHDTSFAFGLRKVVGVPPEPNGGGDCIGTCTNVSFQYHVKTRRSELYVGYGDPSQLVTVPQFVLKFIYYLGAEKGT